MPSKDNMTAVLIPPVKKVLIDAHASRLGMNRSMFLRYLFDYWLRTGGNVDETEQAVRNANSGKW